MWYILCIYNAYQNHTIIIANAGVYIVLLKKALKDTLELLKIYIYYTCIIHVL